MPKKFYRHHSFICIHCLATVAACAIGTQHRNHCPRCLWSRHLDQDRPGDRRSACHSPMEPIAIEVRPCGEWAIIHRCTKCGTLRINRVAGDDHESVLLALALRPLSNPAFPLLKAIKAQQQHSDRVIIKADGRITFLNTHEIDWIQADDKYVHLHTGKGTRMVRKTLKALEAELDPNRFVRIHRSVIVNVDRIKELQPSFSGQHAVLMENGIRLTLGRNYKDKLFELLGKPL